VLARLRRRILALLLKALGALVLASALAVLCLRWLDPPTSAFMLQNRLVASPADRLRYDWVDWEAISPNAKVAVVAAEDQRFPIHRGFDLDSIADAVRERMSAGRSRGASTISQQVAKNLFLWPGKSFLRKGLEAYFTVLIELLWTKQRVLEVYLNVAQFGERVFGIEAASRIYFGKPARALTPREAATLAAVLPNPVRYRVEPPSPYVLERTDWILAQVEMLGGAAYVGGLSK
jgi:monofunctional biosynthetic peptidoglycan transglycosylase